MLPILFIMLLPILGIAFTFGIPAYRLKRAIRRPFPAHFTAILRRNIPTYSGMPLALQEQLQRLVKQFLHQKKFVGCDGVDITDEMRVTIAGKACMLLLNRAPRVYPNLDLILVYPSAFIVPRNEIGIGGIVTHAHQHLSGESWSDGRVILAWDHVQQADAGYDSRHDVVLHEFAHQLDSESGSTNGAPYLPTTSRYQRWAATLSQAYFNLQMAAANQTESAFDYYGATNPAEFFAVATETFFTDPATMAAWEPALFDEFKNYYRVDPREWVDAEVILSYRRPDAAEHFFYRS